MKVYCSQKIKPKLVNGNFKVGYLHEVSLKPNDTITFRKFISVIDNRYEKNHNLNKTAITKINNAYNQGFDSL
jgi:predicted ATPase